MKQRLAAGLATAAAIAIGAGADATARQVPAAWHFVVSGDARNCGDIIAPAIAATARANDAAFYWHLGDLRRSSSADEDIAHLPQYVNAPLSRDAYHAMEWQDFIDHQIAPFGALPYFVGIGNHEVAGGQTRAKYLELFSRWLDAPVLKAQRAIDAPGLTEVPTYYHWIDRGVAFYFLDNASNDMFDDAQIAWFEAALAKDAASPAIHTIVAGMHKPLPDGYNTEHSMNESPRSTETGRRVAADLLKAQHDQHKRVYVLASHQHFYMPDAYDTPYWKDHGGVLTGWVVGTAGATRYVLPDPHPDGSVTNVYGSLVATVSSSGEIAFAFAEIKEPDIPKTVVDTWGQEFVHWCFVNNTEVK